jgi:hypothetical protein
MIKKKRYDNNINIDFENKYFCYILGLLWGDGYISKDGKDGRVSVTMISEDLDTLVPLFNKIGKWRVNKRVRKGNKEQLTIRVSDKSFYELLLTLDYDKKSKTSPNKVVELLPINNIKYFLRGFFDADGCFYINSNTRQCIITSNYHQNWDFISKLYEYKGWKYSIGRHHYKNGSSSFIRITNKSIIEFGEYIYDDFFGLNRKYIKFVKIKESYNREIFRVGYNKKIIYIDDIRYDSITEAVNITGINREVIRYRLKSKNYNYKYD